MAAFIVIQTVHPKTSFSLSVINQDVVSFLLNESLVGKIILNTNAASVTCYQRCFLPLLLQVKNALIDQSHSRQLAHIHVFVMA